MTGLGASAAVPPALHGSVANSYLGSNFSQAEPVLVHELYKGGGSDARRTLRALATTHEPSKIFLQSHLRELAVGRKHDHRTLERGRSPPGAQQVAGTSWHHSC